MGAQSQRNFDDYVHGQAPALLRFACLLTGDFHAAEDLLQIVMARLGQRWDSVCQTDNVDAYVRAALSKRAVSQRRARQRRPIEVLQAVPSDRPDQTPIDTELRDKLRQALLMLPGRQRAVIVLRYYEGYSEKQIADALGCSQGTVKSQAAKARASLKAALGRLLEEDSRE